MADYVVTGPDGARYKVTAPDAMPMDEVLARFRREYGGQQPAPTTPPAPPPTEAVGKTGAPETPPTTPPEIAEQLVPPAPALTGQPPPVAPPSAPAPAAGGSMPSLPGFTPLVTTQTPDGRLVVTPPPAAGGASDAQDVGLSGLSGLARALVGIPGIPGNLEWLVRRGAEVTRQAGWGSAATGQPETLAGAPSAPDPPSSVRTFLPTSEDVIGAFESGVAPITHTPQTRAGRYSRALGEFAPMALMPTRAAGLPAQIATRVGGNVVAPALASEGLGQALEGTRGEMPGRIAGALLGPYLPRAAVRAVTPLPAAGLRTGQTAVLDAEGVPLTAGQRTGRRPLMYAESAAQEMPFVGGRIGETIEQQGVAFTQAAMRRVDEAGATIQPGGVATPEWIRQQRARIGGQFDNLTANHDIVFTGRAGRARGQALEQAALQLEAEYNALVPEALQRNPLVRELVDDIANAVAQGRIDGASYQAWRSRFARMTDQYRSDPEFMRFVRGLREGLDDAMESGIPQAARDAWRQARREWRHLLVLEDAVASAGVDAALGMVTPQSLARAARSGDRSGYARGIVPFSDIAHAGSAVMERLPNSGTPARLAAMYGIPAALASGAGWAADIAMGNPGTFSGAGIAGALLPPVAGRVITSRPMQRWLGNQALAGPLNAMGPTTPGIVGRALALSGMQPETLSGR